ncbi:MAG: glutathione binding-like protein [Pseudomonadota bacterium]|jgi:GST-like protein|nr:glutathione binding-like protein [Pseudomonadota bacterium]
MKLWTAATPNGWKVNIMVEELIEAGIDMPEVEIRTINLGKGEQFTEEFVKHCPNAKIPVLIDGDTSVMESCAILQYLGEKFPCSLLPEGDARWQVLQWSYWQAANVGPVFGNKLSYTRYMDDVPPEEKKHPMLRFGTEALRLVGVLDRQLQGQDYVCGHDLTIADIAIYPWLRGWKWSKVNITEHENVVNWIKRVRARPGVERGLSYGVPKDEIDQWSEERKAQYRKGGASIAANPAKTE